MGVGVLCKHDCAAQCAYDLYECDTFSINISIGWDWFLTRATFDPRLLMRIMTLLGQILSSLSLSRVELVKQGQTE